MNRAVGEAKTTSKIEPLDDQEPFKSSVILDPKSLTVYPLNPILPENIKARLFQKLTKQEYHEIRSRTGIKPSPGERQETLRAEQRYEAREKSKEHRQLEKILKEHPERIERGLRFVRAEYQFPTGDRIDVLLVDSTDKFVTAEIEPAIEKGEIVGLLQALKYRCMFAAFNDLDESKVRGLLVATRIHNSVKQQCRKYGIEARELRIIR